MENAAREQVFMVTSRGEQDSGDKVVRQQPSRNPDEIGKLLPYAYVTD